MNISPDAVEDEKMGTVYKLKISLEKQQMIVNGQNVNIVPGMTVSAEIKTGERRIIEVFLEPVIKYVDEGLKLRYNKAIGCSCVLETCRYYVNWTKSL